MSRSNDLIAALATPDAVSAIAVVRLTGEGAAEAVEAIMKLPSGRLKGMRRVFGDFAGIDDLVAISWPGDRSYTGEAMVDLMCHGAPGIPGAVLHELMKRGARQAEPGEFTRRAWLNGKITEMDVLVLSSVYRNIRYQRPEEVIDSLILLLSEIEALIEFGEEHEVGGEESIERMLEDALKKIASIRERVSQMEILPRVFIMGPVNAGKSTLFNILCGKNAALVSEEPGTTRDGAVRTVTLKGRQVQICDTAGTGGTNLDGKALDIVLQEIRKGDNILWLDPAGIEPPAEITGSKDVMRIASKADIAGKTPIPGWHPFSARLSTGTGEIIEFCTETGRGSPSRAFQEAENSLREAEIARKNGDLALAAEHLSNAMGILDSPPESTEAIERALEMFCVGK